MVFDFSEHMRNAERTITSRFVEASSIAHVGDRGENREEFLRTFLQEHLPSRYGLAKGHVVTRAGQISHSADIVIYDRSMCPVFYSGQTAILPIEGVYGIIEVKSSLPKSEFEDAAKKIKTFKELAPRDLGIIDLGEAMTLRRASRPFGVIFGYKLADNSLDSLRNNVIEFNKSVYNTNYFVNLVCILGVGNIYLQGLRWDMGEKFHLLDTDAAVLFAENVRHDSSVNIKVEDKYGYQIVAESSQDSFGRFLSYVQVILSRMLLNTPDIGTYIGAGMPPLIVKQA